MSASNPESDIYHRDAGCTRHGNLISKPVPLEQLKKMLKERRESWQYISNSGDSISRLGP